MVSALSRLLRMGQVSTSEYAKGLRDVGTLHAGWREVAQSGSMRAMAEDFQQRFPLHAADALQLAAAWVRSEGAPKGCLFVSGDAQLLSASAQLCFNTIECG